MAAVVGSLAAALGQRQELVAHVDERHPPGAAAQREVEQAAVELERLLDVADLERDVVDADQAGHVRTVPFARWSSTGSSIPSCRRRWAAGRRRRRWPRRSPRRAGSGSWPPATRRADAVRADIEALRALTDRPFGVNLFAPPVGGGRTTSARSRPGCAAEAERYGAPVGEPRHDDDGWEAKLALMAELEVPVVSFTFGCPSRDVLARRSARPG